MSEEFTRIASALERIANALEHLHIEKIDHAHIDDIGEIHGDVHCFIDEEEVDCATFKEIPVDLEAEEWIRKQSYGGSAET